MRRNDMIEQVCIVEILIIVLYQIISLHSVQ